jgi:DNA-directed RNA polymerase specialized sigma24 family protein
VSWREQFEAWLRRILDERVGLGAAFIEGVNHGQVRARARDLAEEAVQEAQCRAVREVNRHGPGRFASYRHLCNWIRKVAINNVRGVLRRERRQRQFAEGEADRLEVPAAGPKTWSDAEDVRDWWERLFPADRRLLELYYDDGLTLNEVADHLLSPDGRTANARRLEVWRRLRDLVRDLRRHRLGDEPALSGGD